jgi:WD40 repeat protein
MNENNPRRQAAFLLAEELLTDASLQIVQALAQSIARTPDRDIQQGVLEALEKLPKQNQYNIIWEVWMQSRSPELETFLIHKGEAAERPLKLKVFSSLLLGQKNWLHNAGPEIIGPLLSAAADQTMQIAQDAQDTLLRLDNPESHEELCRWVIEHDHPQARKAALKANLAPQDPYQRALFYLLTEQWEKYESLDFDASLLRAVYKTSDQKTRDKITKFARRTGWSGYVDAISTSGDIRSIQQIDDSEWKVILSVLGRSQRWEDIWRLAQEAPPYWSAKLLRILGRNSWEPIEDSIQNDYKNLLRQALKCLEQETLISKFVHSTSNLRGHDRRITALQSCPVPISGYPFIATGSADGSVGLWMDEDDPSCELLTGHSSYITCLTFSPDGQTLASGSADRSVRIWRTSDGHLDHLLGGHADEISALAYHPNGKILASSDTITTKIWDSLTGRLIQILPNQEGNIIHTTFSPGGDYLANIDDDKSCHLFHIESGQHIKTIMERVTSACFSPNTIRGKKIIATASPYGKVRLWNLPEGDLVNTLDERIDGKLISFSTDGRLLAASDRETVRIWNIPEGNLLQTIHGPKSRITSISFSPDGSQLACAAEDRTAWLWQLSNQEIIYKADGLQKTVDQLIFSSNGNHLIFADQETITVIRLFNYETFLKNITRQISNKLIDAAERILESTPTQISKQEWNWLEFTKNLARWQGRFDIEIESPSSHITVGEFDIEIAG